MPVFARVAHYFEEVARRGSIRRAAEHLHVTASAVDRQVLLLEERIGTALFERLPRGVRLTAAGELLLASVQQLGRDFDATVSALDALRGLRRGHVTIMGLQFLAEKVFPDLVRNIRNLHPGISVSAFVGTTEEVLNAVLAGEADFGIAYAPEGQLPIQTLRSLTLNLGAVIAPSHPLAALKKTTFTTCLQHSLILPRQGMELRSRIERIQSHSAIELRPTIETNSIGMMKSILRNGTEVGFLTNADVAADVAAGHLVWLPLIGSDVAPSIISLIAPNRRAMPLAATAMVEPLKLAFDSITTSGSPRARTSRPKKLNAAL
jgi:DNA-binding transcriptional LysR family regulator